MPKPASSSSLLVWVRVHFATFTKLVGVTWIADASGGIVGRDAPVITVLSLLVVVDGDLVLLLTCNAIRARVLTMCPSSIPGG